MKICIVISNAFSFIQSVEKAMRLVLDPWTIREAVSYDQAWELLWEGPVQLVLADEGSMPVSPEAFLRTQKEAFPDTWFVAVGKERYEGISHLNYPFDDQSLGFFMQQKPTPENRQLGQWFREYMAGIYPILLSHFWTGLLNRWVLSDRTMIMMASRRMNIPNLENTHVLPILIKTVHQNKVDTDFGQATRDHLFFQELFKEHILLSDNAGTALDRFSQKWAVIYYSDMYPATPAEMFQRCVNAARTAEDSAWQVSFYIGNPCLPENLLDQWTQLEALSEEDAGFHSRIVQLKTHGPRTVAPQPDMHRWQMLLDQGKCVETKDRISAFLMDLAREDQLDAQWLSQFRDVFLREIYRTIQFHGVPIEKVLTDQPGSESFNRSTTSVRQLHGWVCQCLDNLSNFLESESPDTPVKKAQRYILQNLDQPLSRDDIAAHVFISSGYLGRIFKKELNVSLSEYIYDERMKLAAKMLEQSDQFVTSIALSVGFSNFPYFSTQFKKYSGLTPVEYRKKHSEKEGPYDPDDRQS